MKRLLRAALLLAAVPALAALPAGPAAAAEIRLRILETSDVHMNLVDYDYYQDRRTEEYGLSRTATLIAAARAQAPNSLYFDNGDLLQGSPLGDEVARHGPLDAGRVHPAVRMLAALRVDAANIGNHEFNFGLPFLRSVIAGAPFPFLSANVVLEPGGEPAFTPYVILERQFVDDAGLGHALKVGVIGFVPPQILQWDRQHLAGRVKALDIVDTARRLVPEMKARGADVVVALAHSGLERGASPPFAENAVGRLAEVPGIDALLFGHSHGEFPGPYFAHHPKVDLQRGTLNGIPAVMPGFWGNHLGVVDLVLSDEVGNDHGAWRVKSSHAELRPVYDRAARQPLAAADARLAERVAPEHEATLAALRRPVAFTTRPLHSYFAQVADDASVHLVASAQREALQRALQGTAYESLPVLSAAAPFKTGGRQGWNHYTDIPAGPLALRHVADLYVYPNTLQGVLASGAQVREWLEMAAGQFNRIDPAGAPEQELLNPAFPGYNFDTLDGVHYRIDITQPARYDRGGHLVAPQAHRIVDLSFQGRPLEDTARFIVATNNYRASGGGNFPGLDGSSIVVDAADENREALVHYLKAMERITPAAGGHWSLLPVPGVKLRFTSGAGAIAHLAEVPAIRLVKDNGDGSALFEIEPGARR